VNSLKDLLLDYVNCVAALVACLAWAVFCVVERRRMRP